MHRKNLLLSITIAFTVSFCFPGLSLADIPTDIDWSESSADRAVRDENGDLLKGELGESETSDFVQLIYAGADEEADPPTNDGGVTGDDELIATSYIGERLMFKDDEGLWSSNSMHNVAVGSKLYARAWNAPNSSEWTYYGDSPDHHTVTLAPTQTYRNAGNFSTTNTPDVPTASAAASPTSGNLPLTVTLTGTATDDGIIMTYLWDFEGDGQYDWASTTTGITSHTYTSAGQYAAVVMVTDESGLSDADSVTITVSAPSSLKVWINTPGEGSTVWGQKVSLSANGHPGNLIESVQFQYKKSSDTAWTDVGNALTTPPYMFGTTWDTTSFTDGDTYNLRVQATSTSDETVNSEAVSVTVSQTNTIVSETLNNSGNHQLQQSISSSRTETVSMYDGTQLEIPYGAVTSDSIATVVILSSNSYTTAGANSSLTSFRSITLEDDPTLSLPVTVVIPYDDADNDGYLDGNTSIAETDISLYCYDTASSEWKKIADSTVDTTNNTVTASVAHLSDFALADPDYTSPGGSSGGGGGGGCFVATAVYGASTFWEVRETKDLDSLVGVPVKREEDGQKRVHKAI